MKKFLLALIILAGLAFPLWDQQLLVKAVDQNGNPVADALVQIAYQKLNAVSMDNDGLVVGKTDANGLFYANLSNRVPAAYESRELHVSLSTFYWDGEKKTATANSSELKAILFTVPAMLQKVAITVFDSENWAMEGASVTVLGSDLKKTTASDGKAEFSLPSGTPFSGFVFYNGTLAGQFSSSDISGENGTQAISVHIPYWSPSHDINASKHGKIILRLFFTEKNGTPMAGQAVSFSYLGKASSATADPAGVAAFTAGKSGTVGIFVKKYDYTYAFSLDLVVRNGTNASIEQNGSSIVFTENGTDINASVTVALYPLLNINSFSASEEGGNCFGIYANISDPRTGIPMQVQMSEASADPPSAYSGMQTTLDDTGLYYSHSCINKSNARVKVVASNRYERTEAELNLTYTAPLPPTPPKKPQDRTMEMVAGACTALAVMAFILFYIYWRKNPAVTAFMGKTHGAFAASSKQLQDYVLRPVSEYLRVFRKIMRGKKGL